MSIPEDNTERKTQPHDPLGKRVLIGRLIQKGIEPPVFLEPDVLIEGLLHWLYGDSESGKTWLALWLVKQRIEAEERVVYLDCENGPEVIGERLELLGCDPRAIDQHMAYYEEPELQLDKQSVRQSLNRIEEINPSLTVFDSTRGFLTAAGLEESSNDDLDKLYSLLLKPIRSANRTAAVLDHTGHSGNHARGAKRKRDMCDVMFQVSSTGFDESYVGEVHLTRKKGRRGHVPYRVTFSAGGGEESFVFARSDGTITDYSSLTEKDRQVLEFIVAGGPNGVSYKQLLAHMGGKKSTVSDSTGRLREMRLIRRDNGRYYACSPTEPTRRRGGGQTEPSPTHSDRGASEPENRTDKRGTNGSEVVRKRFGRTPEPAARDVGSDGSVFLGTEPSEPARPGFENGRGEVGENKRHSQGFSDSVAKPAERKEVAQDDAPSDNHSSSLAEDAERQCGHGYVVGTGGCYTCDPMHPLRKQIEDMFATRNGGS